MTATDPIVSQLNRLRQSLRPGQKPLAEWSGGALAVAAVPGAGKSHSLSVAAALAIAQHRLHSQRQLVIVTYTRSAAAAIKFKIRQRLQELQLPSLGFMVLTIHGLALNIASRYPELSGLDLESKTLVTPHKSHRLVRTAVEHWIEQNPLAYRALLETAPFDGEETERLRRQSALRTEILPDLTTTVVHEAKSSGLSPQAIKQLSQIPPGSEALAYAAGLYEQYEYLMQRKNWIDYDDMILAALRVLDNPTLCQSWQEQIFAVFEDEAQDSSPLQEQLINRLALRADDSDAEANLIRVGDPNQAINSSFTPADPLYFNWFCDQCDQRHRLTTMDQAGRSHPLILEAANFVVDWVNQDWAQRQPALENDDHPLRLSVPFRAQKIRPVDADDPQPNPTQAGRGLELYQPQDVFQTVQLLGQRLRHLLGADPQRNAAILVRENRQGRFVAQQLQALLHSQAIRIYEVSETSRYTKIPEEMLKFLQFIERPHSPDYLKAVLEVLQERRLIPAQDLNALVTAPEQFLYPSPLAPPLPGPVQSAQRYCRTLLRAKLELPYYQLLVFLGMTLQYDGSALATLHKLSERIQSQLSQQGSLRQIVAILQEILASESFEGVEEDSEEIYTRPNQVTVITMHKAKGLDWDYVFVPFLHEDSLPGQLRVPAAARFLGDQTLAEVARAQIRTAIHYQHIHQHPLPQMPNGPKAWQEADRLKQAEEYRLLYVAITRAKRLLWLSAAHQAPFWGTFRGGKNQLQNKRPSRVFLALQHQFPASVVERA
ncbi:ATP-dependent helicase [Synechocystis sp. LKSZ1]|uniref:ATP-dependent helicase n=1 Tax=Synechocystis sp. LKSZ1 TaxID=3144951 RepID=UPI00336C0111